MRWRSIIAIPIHLLALVFLKLSQGLFLLEGSIAEASEREVPKQ